MVERIIIDDLSVGWNSKSAKRPAISRRLLFLFVCNVLITDVRVYSQALVINEVMRNNDTGPWIELYNNDSVSLSLDAFAIKIDSSALIPLPPKLILPGGFASLSLSNAFSPVAGDSMQLPFTPDSLFRFVSLVDRIQNIIIDRVDLSIEPFPGESVGRLPDGSGRFILFPAASVSYDGPNETPGPWIKHANRTAFSPRDSSPNASIVHNDTVWLFSGYRFMDSGWDSFSDVYKSGDGATWDLVNEHPPYHPYSAFVSFNGRMWAFGTHSFHSEDGKSWTPFETNIPLTESMRVTIHNGAIWLLFSASVYRSENGVDWTIVTQNAKFGPRDWPAFASFKGRLWVFGGGAGYISGSLTVYNDVWASDDGVDWELVTANASWPGRYWFTSGVYDDKLWLVGGWTEAESVDPEHGNSNSVWISDDGRHWIEVFRQATWPARHAHFTFSFKDRLWISAGYGHGSNTRLYNDVWSIAGKTFIAQPGQDISTVGGWNSHVDGTGQSPEAFHKPGQIFLLGVGQTFLADTLRISGTGSTLVVGSGERILVSETGFIDATVHLGEDVAFEFRNGSNIRANTVPVDVICDMSYNPFRVTLSRFHNLTIRNARNPEFRSDSVFAFRSLRLENTIIDDSLERSFTLHGPLQLDSASRIDGLKTDLTFHGFNGRVVSSGREQIHIRRLRVNLDTGDLYSNVALRSSFVHLHRGRIITDSQPFLAEKFYGGSIDSYIVTNKDSYVESRFGPEPKIIPVGTAEFYTPTTIRRGFSNEPGRARIHIDQFGTTTGDTINVIWNIASFPPDQTLYSVDFEWYPSDGTDAGNFADSVAVFAPQQRLENDLWEQVFSTGPSTRIENYKIFLPASFSVRKSSPATAASEVSLSLFPNPCGDILYILMPRPAESATYQILNDIGQRVPIKSEMVLLGETIDTSGLPAGIYILDIITPEGRLRKKFVKN